jgi:hypothetical protein
MKFKLVDDLVFWWPVKVSIPDTTKPGQFVEQELEIEFEALSQNEAQELDKLLLDADSVTARLDRENILLRRVCRDWRGVVGENDQPIGFSSDALNKALGFGWFRTGVYLAYASAMAGDQARLKN